MWRKFITLSVLLLSRSAFALDSGYRAVDWMEVLDDNTVRFVLDNGQYYKCGVGDLCHPVLLTALASQREVKAFYADGWDGELTNAGEAENPWRVTQLRIH